MSVSMSTVATASDGSSSPSAAKIIEAARARGVSFAASDDLYQLGPRPHAASGDVPRSVESPSNQRARKCGIRFAGMVAGAWPCSGVRLDWQLYFWHWFLLDSKVARHGEAGIRCSLGVLGNVDNRSGDALGRQHAASTDVFHSSFAWPICGSWLRRCLPSVQHSGIHQAAFGEPRGMR